MNNLMNRLVFWKKIIQYFFMFNIVLFFSVRFLVYTFGLENIELPNDFSNMQVIDRNGHIFWGSNTLSRVQEYDDEGRFVKGWLLDADGGGFYFGIGNDDIIHVLVGRSKVYKTLDRDGNILSQKQLVNKSEYKSFKVKILRSHWPDIARKRAIKKIKRPFYWYPFYFYPTTFIYFALYSLMELYVYIYKKKYN